MEEDDDTEDSGQYYRLFFLPELDLTQKVDPNYRSNAILFTGEPISNLRTARLFAYATHFDAHPMGLEWVDDKTCVFVFSSKKDAKEAFSKLTKPTPASTSNALTSTEDVAPMALDDPVDVDFISAKPFPVALWPPEERINSTLGKGQGLKGPIRMRWAKVDDIKQKGARDASQFYKKHGKSAGKELFNGRELPPASEPMPGKRKREFDEEEENERRRQELDRELDDFLREDDDEESEEGDRRRKRTRRLQKSASPLYEADARPTRPASPPSKMRSDYISRDGRTLLERTSVLRRYAAASDPLDEAPGLASRLTAPLPRRAVGRRRGGRDDDGRNRVGDHIRSSDYEGSGSDREMTRRRGGRKEDDRRSRGGGGGRPVERPKKTQQELDDELDAFLNAKD